MDSKANLTKVAESICKERELSFGEYVGGGAFKQVFRVETSDSRVYALKVIKGSASKQRTEREIQAIQKCNHPNIGKLFSVSNHNYHGDSYVFTLEEFFAGGTLASFLEQNGLLDNKKILELGKPLIDAISHIDALNLVHRDIKPDNIMFKSVGNSPVLVDFGLVRDLSAVSLTQSWLNCGPGTPYFAAPEQLNNQKYLIDWRTDQFSLGVTFCYACFGIHPYQLPDESDLSGKTVARVAKRDIRSNAVLDKFEQSGLKCLKVMTNAWPVERFRTPNDLKRAWQKDEGA